MLSSDPERIEGFYTNTLARFNIFQADEDINSICHDAQAQLSVPMNGCAI